jgi:hypothetical protein
LLVWLPKANYFVLLNMQINCSIAVFESSVTPQCTLTLTLTLVFWAKGASNGTTVAGITGRKDRSKYLRSFDSGFPEDYKNEDARLCDINHR